MIGQSAGRSRKNPTTGAVRSTPRQRQRLVPPPGAEVESLDHRWRRGKALVHIALMWVGIFSATVAPQPWAGLGLIPILCSWVLVAREASWSSPARRYTPEG